MFNNLRSLKGCPEHVSGSFSCSFNELLSLENSPEYVGKSFNCNNNSLFSFKGISNYIGGDIELVHNKIKTFQYFPNLNEDINLFDNHINELWNLFENEDYIEYFNELDIIQDNGDTVILDRLNYFLTDIGLFEVNKDYIKKYIVK